MLKSRTRGRLQFDLGHCCNLVLLLLFFLRAAHSVTDPEDVYALSVLYTSLNSPPLTGWGSATADPCGEQWQGIECAGPNVTAIRLPGLGISGWLGYALDNFTGLLTLDLSSNSLGQMIPFQLPPRIQEVNLAYNQFTEALPVSFRDLISLISVNVSSNQLVGPIPDIFQDLTSLTSLDLSGNQFNSALPPSMASLSSLITLRMENNQLSGDINLLGNLEQLQDVDIENNKFTGFVPPNLLSLQSFKGAGNQFNLNSGPSPSPAPGPEPVSSVPSSAPSPSPVSPLAFQQPNNTNKQNPDHKLPKGGPVIYNIESSRRRRYWNAGKIAGLAVASLLALVAALLVVLFFCGKRTSDERDEEKTSSAKPSWHPLVAADKVSRELFAQPRSVIKPLPPPPIEKQKPQSPVKLPPATNNTPSKVQAPVQAFSVSDLQAATNSFSQDNLIGEGALGRVYKAEFEDGKILAVKKLETSAVNVQDEDEFLKVVATIARLRHPNVNELVGYCCEYSQRLLVYEFVDHGTLYETLHASVDPSTRLSWNERVKIALGAARALEYLHEVCHPPIVHRNFKSANVLLDMEGTPRVSDCGLAALAPFGSDRQVSTQMLGSFGYSAPEFAMSGVYTVKSDVYSFGVVMLELLTGRKSLDSSRSRGEQSLVRWATPQLHDIDALSRMVDPSLKGMYPAKSLSRFADIISSCVQPEPEFRPPMSEVVQALVRLMQRASLGNRRLAGDDFGSSTRSLDRFDPSE